MIKKYVYSFLMLTLLLLALFYIYPFLKNDKIEIATWKEIKPFTIEDINLEVYDFKHDEDIFIEDFINPLVKRTNDQEFNLINMLQIYREIKALIPDDEYYSSGYIETLIMLKEGDILSNEFKKHNISSEDSILIIYSLNIQSNITSIQLEDSFILYQDNDGNVYGFIYYNNKNDEFHYYIKNNFIFEKVNDFSFLKKPKIKSTVEYKTYLVLDEDLSNIHNLKINKSMINDIKELYKTVNNKYNNSLKYSVLHIVYENRHNQLLNTVEQNIISLEIRKRDQSIYVIKFSNGKDWSYFYEDGYSILTTFLRHPIEKNYRLSSPFSPNRFHPVYKRYLPHNGQDYAAPKGTPILASGNGIIEFKGFKNGYGNTIIIDHENGYKTLYAHMSKYNHMFDQGDRVNSGMIIGYVGKTGTATGNHLHYELHKDGIPIDPLKSKLPGVAPIKGVYYDLFKEYLYLIKNSHYKK